jgi:hypothetical protein
MKQSILILFSTFLFVVSSLSAQTISKGTHTLGSSLTLPAFSQSGLFLPNQAGFTTTSVEEDVFFMDGVDEYSFDQYFIHSGYSYFVANNFSLGADLTLVYSDNEFMDGTEFYLSPELRYYLRSPFFLSVAGNMAYVDDEFDFNSASLSAGYNFFVSSDWAIEPRVTYTHLIGDEIRTIRGEGIMGELSFRYFPGRTAGDSSAVESALKKGNFLFGGSGTFSSAQEDFTYIYLSPRAGYFVSDNLVLGAGLNYSYQYQETPSFFGSDPTEFTSHLLLGNIFARYYLYEGLFAEVDGGLMLFNSAKVDGETPEVYNPAAWYYNARLGYSWFISSTIALEPSFRFGRLFTSEDFEVLDGELNTTIETLETVERSFGLEFSIHVFLNR